MIYYTIKRSDSKYLANKDEWLDSKYKEERHPFLEYNSTVWTAEFYKYFTNYDFEIFLQKDGIEELVYETRNKREIKTTSMFGCQPIDK